MRCSKPSTSEFKTDIRRALTPLPTLRAGLPPEGGAKERSRFLPPPQGDEGSETIPSAKPYPCLVSDPLASAERSEAEGVKALKHPRRLLRRRFDPPPRPSGGTPP